MFKPLACCSKYWRARALFKYFKCYGDPLAVFLLTISAELLKSSRAFPIIVFCAIALFQAVPHPLVSFFSKYMLDYFLSCIGSLASLLYRLVVP